MTTTETPSANSPARAACEAFWAAVGAGSDTQTPEAAWDWAFAQNTTRAWEAAAKAAVAAYIEANGRDPVDARSILAEAACLPRPSVTGYGPTADALRLEHERDEARVELVKAGELIRRLERITTAWTRGMYSARIDILRGDTKAAIECLSEGLDGYDGPEWDGKETGAQWWERTKAEEGL